IMADGLARMPAEIAELAGVGASVARALVDLGALILVGLPEFETYPQPDPDFDTPTLNPDQRRAAEHLRDAVKKREFSVTLLDGVTGSGKTETYFEAVAEAVVEGRQALILLPE